MQTGKIIIFSAPSGAGKTTIVKHLLANCDYLGFSISACTRPKREHEIDGKDYYFISSEQFKAKIEANEFVEWQEVYENSFYGTLKSEVERIWQAGKHVIFDVDVKGGLNLKKYYQSQALAIFITTPSMEILEERLRNRQTETEESLQKRIKKFKYEVTFANQFDKILINAELTQAFADAQKLVDNFVKG